ncbi:GNAT family N-acetyltransferase [Algibacter miyuki]|uniref:GNAT family N-acetyltransferase n=1 Tax=Algibacter miyuki TaxID=1306933 RepID=A0ABV5GXW2_9FLAO|nr:GNAT family N-acetyltransferase [Algibacter miyuki]MDN3664289.1 GNAT family N-acetyltransferase [Algibacter miyuki]
MLYRNTYRLKRLEKSDFPAVKKLFWEVFNKRVSLEYLENKYNTSYLGVEFICSIAYYNNIPVAFYGAIPQKFIKNGHEIYVAHACDSYTMPDHQRKGLHFQLAKFAYNIMVKNNIKFVYAFHSENTYFSTKKLEWKEHVPLQRFHITVKTLPFGKVLNKIGWNNFYALFFNQKVSQNAIEKLMQEKKSKHTQLFTPEFISYKNSFKKHYCIEIEGCVFWIKIEAIIHVGLSYAPSEIALQKAIKKLKRKAFLLGITELLFQVDPKSVIASQLKTIVNPKKSWLVGYLDFAPNINLNNFTFTYSDLDTF